MQDMAHQRAVKRKARKNTTKLGVKHFFPLFPGKKKCVSSLCSSPAVSFMWCHFCVLPFSFFSSLARVCERVKQWGREKKKKKIQWIPCLLSTCSHSSSSHLIFRTSWGNTISSSFPMRMFIPNFLLFSLLAIWLSVVPMGARREKSEHGFCFHVFLILHSRYRVQWIFYNFGRSDSFSLFRALLSFDL